MSTPDPDVSSNTDEKVNKAVALKNSRRMNLAIVFKSCEADRVTDLLFKEMEVLGLIPILEGLKRDKQLVEDAKRKPSI